MNESVFVLLPSHLSFLCISLFHLGQEIHFQLWPFSICKRVLYATGISLPTKLSLLPLYGASCPDLAARQHMSGVYHLCYGHPLLPNMCAGPTPFCMGVKQAAALQRDVVA